MELFSKCWVQFNNQLRVDRDKPRNLEFSLWFMDFGLRLWTEDDSGLPTGPFTITKTLFDIVLLEQVGLICVLPLAVHLLFGLTGRGGHSFIQFTFSL